ncbi:hypothetical protein GDO81_008544 [Engystomops pustulosus]|uniref:Uncharacterized protein n=1 Tax=Engystomops pustulosus TaxID=76066 RepID=A0AAV7CFE8_ENGPU|nr:hypothetical protein GDO81_008544 [Engystomops pustulosus]
MSVAIEDCCCLQLAHGLPGQYGKREFNFITYSLYASSLNHEISPQTIAHAKISLLNPSSTMEGSDNEVDASENAALENTKEMHKSKTAPIPEMQDVLCNDLINNIGDVDVEQRCELWMV